jgi:hypothetical protein
MVQLCVHTLHQWSRLILAGIHSSIDLVILSMKSQSIAMYL